MVLSDRSNTILRPPWLHVARGVWLFITAAAIVLFVIGAVNAMRHPLPSCTAVGLPVGRGK